MARKNIGGCWKMTNFFFEGNERHGKNIMTDINVNVLISEN
jgi:hypothetical protein